MNRAKDIIELSKYICNKYLRYASEDKLKLYGKALALYLCYYDSYLKLKIDLNIFNFLVKIIRNNYFIDKRLIKQTKKEDIEKSFE